MFRCQRGGGPGNRDLPPLISAALALIACALLAAPRASAAPGKLLLVSVDGMPAGAELLPRWMPFLASCATRGTRYSDATSPSLLPFPATAALLTGCGPERTGVRDEATSGVDARSPSLAAALHELGYQSLGLPADPLLHAGTGLARGFDRYDPRSPGYSDSARADSALAWLRGGGPRFAWIELSFGPPAEAWRRMDGIGPLDTAGFAVRARSVDSTLADLERGLKPLVQDGSAVLVVAGTGAPPPEITDAATTPPAPRCATSLVWLGADAGPNTGEPRVVPASASLVDVAPTLVALAGGRMRESDGRDLRAARPSAPAARSPRTISACDQAARRVLLPPGSSADPGPREAAIRAVLREEGTVPDTITLKRWSALAVQFPDCPRLQLEAAIATSRMGREGLGARAFKSLLAEHPDYAEAAIAYTDHLIHFKRYAIVESVLALVPPTSPLAAVATWRLAMAFAGKQEFASAQATTQRALRLAVLNSDGLDAAAALAGLRAAKDSVDASPEDPARRIRFGLALADFGLYDAAFEQFHVVRGIRPKSAEGDYWIATVLLRLDRANNAIPTLERGVRIDPGHRPARLMLADLYLGAGRRADARAQLEAALAIDPVEPRAQFNLACLLATNGEIAAALGHLELAVAQGYDDWQGITGDPDLQALRSSPRYLTLLKRQPPGHPAAR